MAITEDPYFAGRVADKSVPGKRPGPGEVPPVLPWMAVYLVNMIIPLYFGTMVTGPAGRVGMVFGILLVFSLGCWVCFGSRWAVLRVVYGGWIVAASQFFPILHIFAGSLGTGSAVALGTTTNRRADHLDTVLGGLMADLPHLQWALTWGSFRLSSYCTGDR